MKGLTAPCFNWRQIIGIILLLAGVYLVYTAFSPQLLEASVDSKNNQTTRKLTKTSQRPAKNRLYIPKININLPFAAGDESTMLDGAWWRSPKSGNPKDGGNFVLSAHRFVMSWTPGQTVKKSPFYHIDKLAVGDEIIVDYDNQRYIYQITKTYPVSPDALEIEAPTDDRRLTLYSCTLGGAGDGRDVIIAKLKDSPEP